MVSELLYKCLILFCISKCCKADETHEWGENITKLYELVSNAVKTDNDHPQQTRRVFVNDSQYQIHLNKLKDVNGLKFHNIAIARSGPDINSTIYINNPLESKLPHPFMSLEQFKNILVEQQLKDREEFKKSKKKAENSKIWANIKTSPKLKTNPTLSAQTHKAINLTRTTASNFKTTTNKILLEKAHKIGNSPKPQKTILTKTTNVIKKLHKLANTTDNPDKFSHKALNVSLLNTRFKLLANERTLLSSHKPSLNKSLHISKILKDIHADNQTADSIANNLTAKSENVGKERSSTVKESTPGRELLPNITKTTVKVEGTMAFTTSKDDEAGMDEESTTISETTITDEDIWTGVDEKEVTSNDDDTKETTEEVTTETPTTTTTLSTTREKWSRPRVFMDEEPASNSTSTSN